MDRDEKTGRETSSVNVSFTGQEVRVGRSLCEKGSGSGVVCVRKV